jgi:hypothetical protein
MLKMADFGDEDFLVDDEEPHEEADDDYDPQSKARTPSKTPKKDSPEEEPKKEVPKKEASKKETSKKKARTPNDEMEEESDEEERTLRIHVIASGSNFLDAVNRGDLALVREGVYACHPDINSLFVVNRAGDALSPLMLACTLGSVEMVHLLLRHDDIDVSLPDEQGRPALAHALRSRSAACAIALLQDEDSVNVNALVCFGPKQLLPPLAYACSARGSEEVVAFLLDHDKIDTTKVCDRGLPPLVHAVLSRKYAPRLPTVKLLLACCTKSATTHMSDALDRLLRRPAESRGPAEKEVLALLVACGGMRENEPDLHNRRALKGAAYYRNKVCAGLKLQLVERRAQAVKRALTAVNEDFPRRLAVLVNTYDMGGRIRPRFSPSASLAELSTLLWVPAEARRWAVMVGNEPLDSDSDEADWTDRTEPMMKA